MKEQIEYIYPYWEELWFDDSVTYRWKSTQLKNSPDNTIRSTYWNIKTGWILYELENAWKNTKDFIIWLVSWWKELIEDTGKQVVSLADDIYVKPSKEIWKSVWYYYHLHNYKKTWDSISKAYIDQYNNALNNEIRQERENIYEIPDQLKVLSELTSNPNKLVQELQEQDRAKWIYKDKYHYQWEVLWYTIWIIWELLLTKKVSVDDFKWTWLDSTINSLNNKIEIERTISKISNREPELSKWLLVKWIDNVYRTRVQQKYSQATTVDDIYNISTEFKTTVWSWWQALTVPWTKTMAQEIVTVLENKWWVKEIKRIKGWNKVAFFTSKDWKQRISYREHSRSWEKFSNDWYNVEATIELIKYEWNKSSKKEIKFIKPK